MALVVVPEKKEQKSEPDAEEKEVEEQPLPVFLTEQFGHLLQSKRLTDVIFVVGQEKLAAHRVVMAAASPIFEVMLYKNVEGVPDTKISAPIEVKITGTDAKTFALLLQCIYTDEVEVNADNIQALMKVAKKYQVDKLSALCADFMQGDVNAENALDLFQIAPTLLGDEEFGLKFIEENAEKVLPNDAFTRLTKDRLMILLKSDKLACPEIELFKAVARWAEAEKKRRGDKEAKADVDEVMKMIRFPTMEVAEIASIVAPTGVLEQAQLVQLFSFCAVQDEKVRALMPQPPFPTKPREGLGWAWDEKKHGSAVSISNKGLTAQMSGSSWNNGLVTGNKVFTNGTHYWEVKIDHSTSDMIGVCAASINYSASSCYSNQSSQIWFAHYSGPCYGSYQSSISISASTGQTIGLLLQYDEGSKFFSLTYYKDGYRLGTPFTRIPAPVVAAVELYSSPARITLNSKAKKPSS